jgi:hypothetical protein
VGIGGAPEADERGADAKPGLEERSGDDEAEEHERQALAQATNSSARYPTMLSQASCGLPARCLTAAQPGQPSKPLSG